MKIIGYSERGAMNALFYGMALDCENGKNAMKKFLEIASIEEVGKYVDFDLFIEFSLSEFGSPDLAIVARTEEETKEVFFIEAKASCEKHFDLAVQKKHHIDYMEKGNYGDGHASNLFFQLRQKNYFFEKEVKKHEIKDLHERLRDSRGRERSIGTNGVVRKFIDELQCDKAHFIAIIPDDKEIHEYNGKSFHEMTAIHFVTWEEIKDTECLKKYVDYTIDFNQSKKKGKIISQILNN